MKKLFSALIILASVLMLSGCFFYVEDTSGSSSTKYYDITVENKTNIIVKDWCVIRNGKKTFANSSNCSPIYPNGNSTITHLPEGSYEIYFAYVNSPDEEDYYATKSFDLDSDFTYYLNITDVPKKYR